VRYETNSSGAVSVVVVKIQINLFSEKKPYQGLVTNLMISSQVMQ